MGADLITVCVPQLVGAKRPTVAEIKVAVHTYVEGLDRGHLLDESWDYQLDLSPSENGDPHPLSEYESIVLAIIEETANCLWGPSRDMAWWTFSADSEYGLNVTGGMSWGDDPTEAYTTLSKYTALPGNTAPLDVLLGVNWNVKLTPQRPVPKFETLEEANAWLEGRVKFKEVAEICPDTRK